MIAFFRLLRRARLALVLFGIAGVWVDRGLGGSGHWVEDTKAWFHSATSPASPPTGQPTQPASIAPTTTAPELSSVPAPADSAARALAPALVPAPAPAWTPPAVIPEIQGGTLVTPTQLYTNARILKVEADRVTISHANGLAVIPMWQLSSALQKELNYDPKAALEAEHNPQIPAPPPMPETTTAMYVPPTGPTPVDVTETTDYRAALVAAKTSGKLVLLHFTGSDWCGYCMRLEDEVMSKSVYTTFATSHYITVTLDFPHNSSQSESLKAQNESLSQKYNVSGFPTLVVIDSNEKELGRMSGYAPGSGPDAVISQLQKFNHAN